MVDRDARPRKHSVMIAGHRTSVTLEQPFWQALVDIARDRSTTINALVTEIDAERSANLSSAIRVFVLDSVGNQNRRDRADDS